MGMYIVGHGASQPFSPTSWMQASEVYMARVTPSVEAVADQSQWEFYAGSGKWSRGEVGDAKPLLSWGNRTGVTTMTYIPSVKNGSTRTSWRPKRLLALFDTSLT